MQYKKLWIAFAIVIVVSFAILGGFGFKAIKNAPPIPQQVATMDGREVFNFSTIQNGQGVWQSLGGQEVGSIWGHGAYVAPDWSADFLHRESVYMLDKWARRDGADNFQALPVEQQAGLRARLEQEMRTNTYDPSTGRVTISADRAEAFEAMNVYYANIFAEGRDEYAIPRGALTDVTKAREMSAFFWWTSWAASTNRPGNTISYTQNWPHEPLVGNTITGDSVVWSVISFVLLLAGVGGMVWYFGSQEKEPVHTEVPANDPLLGWQMTPSQRATMKYFYTVAALIVAQVGLGAIAAHYGVEGSSFYGIPLDQWLPYSVARTWHTQLGLFWIATSWLATGLYVAPAVSGYEPKGQNRIASRLTKR
jgi:nitric oxide reductase subunit B